MTQDQRTNHASKITDEETYTNGEFLSTPQDHLVWGSNQKTQNRFFDNTRDDASSIQSSSFIVPADGFWGNANGKQAQYDPQSYELSSKRPGFVQQKVTPE